MLLGETEKGWEPAATGREVKPKALSLIMLYTSEVQLDNHQ